MTSTLSLLGLYNYDGSILDGLTLPDNFTSGDLETLKNNLLMDTAELEILYTDPTFLKYSITQWCNKNKPTWKWLKDTQKYDYVPIWNADYHISDRTNREIGNVGTSHNLEEFTRGLNEDITSQKDYTRNLTESEDTVDELTHGEVIDNTKNSTLTHGYNSSNATTYNTTDTEKHSNNDHTKAYTNRAQTTDHDIVNTGTETTTHNTFAYNDSSTGAPESANVRDINGTNPLRSHESGIVDYFDNLEIGKTKTGTETAAHTGTDTDTLTETTKETHSGKDKRDIDRDLTQAGGDSTHEASHDSQTGGTTTEDTGRTTSDTNDDTKYERYLRGNYGSTSTQSLIKEEQELAKFNLLDFIITDFKKRFCLMVY